MGAMPAAKKDPNWRQELAEKRIAPTQADTQFELVSDFEPKGDQPRAIEELTSGPAARRQAPGAARRHRQRQDVHASRRVIARVNRPALVLAHNKTLAAQLYQEFKAFFPRNAVEYFVSYYDYYQPEAYVPQSDTYIEKDVDDQRRDRPACATRPRAACSSGATS